MDSPFQAISAVNTEEMGFVIPIVMGAMLLVGYSGDAWAFVPAEQYAPMADYFGLTNEATKAMIDELVPNPVDLFKLATAFQGTDMESMTADQVKDMLTSNGIPTDTFYEVLERHGAQIRYATTDPPWISPLSILFNKTSEEADQIFHELTDGEPFATRYLELFEAHDVSSMAIADFIQLLEGSGRSAVDLDAVLRKHGIEYAKRQTTTKSGGWFPAESFAPLAEILQRSNEETEIIMEAIFPNRMDRLKLVQSLHGSSFGPMPLRDF